MQVCSKMKTKSKRVRHALYQFITDLVAKKDSSVRKIKASTNPDHVAYYLPITSSNSLDDSNWQLQEEHLTIERDINLHHNFLSPSHHTLCFNHKRILGLVCKIHLYMDISGNFNGEVLTSVIENNTLRSDVLPIILDETTKRQHAHQGQRVLLELLNKKARAYLALSREIEENDHLLFQKLNAIQPIKDNSVEIDSIKSLINTAIRLNNQLDNYRENEITGDWNYLLRLSDAIKTVELLCPKNTTIDKKAPDIVENVSTLSSCEAFVKSPVISNDKKDQESIRAQVNAILQINTTDLHELIKLNSLLRTINQDLLIYELMYFDPAFVNEVRTQLPPEAICNLSTMFCAAVLEGNLEVVSILFEQAEFTVDFPKLFEELLTTIESKPQTCDRLIQVADYFYQQSELYRAYVLFRLETAYRNVDIEFRGLNGVLVDDFHINILCQMFILSHVKAYEMYLRHGVSPTSIHAFCGQTGFNALQMIILLADMPNNNDNSLICLELLFKHGAILKTVPMRMPEKYFETYSITRSSDLIPTFFNCKSTKGSVKKPLNADLRVVEKSLAKPVAEAKLLTELGQCDSIFSFASKIYFSKNDIYPALVSYSDVKTCLLQFVAITKSYLFAGLFIPSDQGGVLTYSAEKEAVLIAEKNVEPFMQKSGASRFKKNPTIQHLIYFLPKANTQGELGEANLSQALCLNTHLSSLLVKMSRDNLLVLVQELRVLAMKVASSAKEATNADDKLIYTIDACAYLKAAVVAISMIKTLELNDYKLMFTLLYQYAQRMDSLSTLRKSGDAANLKEVLANNVGVLYDSLAPNLQASLSGMDLIKYRNAVTEQEMSFMQGPF